MSLFVVNRFTGEEEQDRQTAALVRFKKLKAEIELRKKKRQEETQENINDESCVVETSNSSVSKRKPRAVNDDIDLNDYEEEFEKKDTQSGVVVEAEINESETSLISAEDPNAIGGFSILGNFTSDSQKAVKRMLPDWLAHPSIIQAGLKHQKLDQSEEIDYSGFEILDKDLREKLSEQGIKSFFPVQRQFIPVLLEDLKCGIFGGNYGLRPRDICVSAPTGSGKTLAFVLPIVQALKSRTVPHIRAAVVLPVRDLADQVYSVFRHYCAGTSLKVGLAVGHKTFSLEQSAIVKKREGLYHSLVDILVATPGRLVDHINSTSGFDLSHLRFLVIDEADRMMEDLKQDWLAALENAVITPAPQAYFPLNRSAPGPLSIASAACFQLPLQKLLFSATLSQNPEKLQLLNLFMPRLLTSIVTEAPRQPCKQDSSKTQKGEEIKQAEDESTDTVEKMDSCFVGKYTTPEGLMEYYIECSAAEKPLVILHFLHNLKFRQVLCFTNSLESTHRLYLLTKLYGGIKVREFSSRLHGERRKKILRQFSNGKVDLLICSDAMARGMDVENVKYVISYDNPPYIKTYIHRIGRTARAGKAGTSLSLLEKKEIFHFKQMMRKAGKWPKIHEMKIGRQALRPLVKPFQAALSDLPALLKGEKKN